MIDYNENFKFSWVTKKEKNLEIKEYEVWLERSLFLIQEYIKEKRK